MLKVLIKLFVQFRRKKITVNYILEKKSNLMLSVIGYLVISSQFKLTVWRVCKSDLVIKKHEAEIKWNSQEAHTFMKYIGRSLSIFFFNKDI